MLPDVHWEEFRNVLERMALQRQEIADSAKLLSDKLAEKSAESAEKSAESAKTKQEKLSKRHRQILNHMKTGELYSTGIRYIFRKKEQLEAEFRRLMDDVDAKQKDNSKSSDAVRTFSEKLSPLSPPLYYLASIAISFPS